MPGIYYLVLIWTKHCKTIVSPKKNDTRRKQLHFSVLFRKNQNIFYVGVLNDCSKPSLGGQVVAICFPAFWWNFCRWIWCRWAVRKLQRFFALQIWPDTNCALWHSRVTFRALTSGSLPDFGLHRCCVQILLQAVWSAGCSTRACHACSWDEPHGRWGSLAAILAAFKSFPHLLPCCVNVCSCFCWRCIVGVSSCNRNQVEKRLTDLGRPEYIDQNVFHNLMEDRRCFCFPWS